MAYQFDVFLSYGHSDKARVRSLAERLREHGLRVWFDDWEIPAGGSIDAGLGSSRILVLCMSAGSFGSDWFNLESQTFRFRDPLNRGLRFIRFRLDDAPIPGSLGQYRYLKGRDPDAELQLLAACRASRRDKQQRPTTTLRGFSDRLVIRPYWRARRGSLQP